MIIDNDTIKELFFNTQHAGLLNCTKPLTVCSRMNTEKNKCSELYLACDEKGLISQAYFKAMGDPYLIASFEWLCRQIEYTQLDRHPYIDYVMMVNALLIPKTRYAVAVLVETNYRQAIHLLQCALEEKNDERSR